MKNLSALLLAAGYGKRLLPLTNSWPKCLMPVQGIPLLEHWLSALKSNYEIDRVFVNTHYKHQEVESFLNRSLFEGWVTTIFEKKLAGTAGVIRNNRHFFYGNPLLVIHADNWFDFNIQNLLNSRQKALKLNCFITMLTFDTTTPENCGIVKLNSKNIVTDFFEKSKIYSGKVANCAIYLFEKEVVNFICDDKSIVDISTDVLPKFLNKIFAVHTSSFFRDLGTLSALKLAQSDPPHQLIWDNEPFFEQNKTFTEIIDNIT